MNAQLANLMREWVRARQRADLAQHEECWAGEAVAEEALHTLGFHPLMPTAVHPSENGARVFVFTDKQRWEPFVEVHWDGTVEDLQDVE